MGDVVSGPDFWRLFETFGRTAWRLETRDRYDAPGEDGRLRQWLAGEPDDLEWHEPWLATLRVAKAAGRTYQRVRCVGDELTDYQRWCLWGAAHNVEAGEDIRYLHHARAAELGVPSDQDWWLFDDQVLALFVFEGNRPLGVQINTDPQTLSRYRQWQAGLWSAATPYPRYVAARAASG
ncbi:MAG: hypothetical protein HYR62_06170 [Actinobacteria bacterium]|nr:hypothetical protein [Actinomycetota bacterium]